MDAFRRVALFVSSETRHLHRHLATYHNPGQGWKVVVIIGDDRHSSALRLADTLGIP